MIKQQLQLREINKCACFIFFTSIKLKLQNLFFKAVFYVVTTFIVKIQDKYSGSHHYKLLSKSSSRGACFVFKYLMRICIKEWSQCQRGGMMVKSIQYPQCVWRIKPLYQADRDGPRGRSLLLSAQPQSPLHLFPPACLLAGGQPKCVEMTPPGRQRFSFISLLPDRRLADIG